MSSPQRALSGQIERWHWVNGGNSEDRKDLLGHKSGDVTTDYSAAELMTLIKAANLIVRSKDSPTLTVLRLVA